MCVELTALDSKYGQKKTRVSVSKVPVTTSQNNKQTKTNK